MMAGVRSLFTEAVQKADQEGRGREGKACQTQEKTEMKVAGGGRGREEETTQLKRGRGSGRVC